MNIEEIDDFKKKIEKETMDKLLEKISVNDSYFYAEMLVYDNSSVLDPFNNKLNVVIKFKLFNSKEFNQNNISTEKKFLKAKEIISKLEIDKEVLQNKEDCMLLIYEEVSKEIAKDLFQANGHNIYKASQNTRQYL